MNKLFALTKNTFVETLRQPVYAIIIIASLLLIFISPSITMYTMTDDNKLLRELGLSTLFLSSLFIAIFAASGAVAEEIENKTITTVLSKPVQRPIFIISKFLGVAASVALAHYICSIALIMAIRHGVLEASYLSRDWTVVVAAASTVILTFLLSSFLNYIYDWKFTSTAIVLLSIFGTLSIAFLFFIDKQWQFNPTNNGINTFDIYASILLFFAVLIVLALAVALSVRFNILVTLSCCVGIFLLGLISNWAFGEASQSNIFAKIGFYIVPNLQVFWISDAIYEEINVPIRYILITGSYAICYIFAILAIAIAAFQRRQVG
ncbi:MAG: ABC-2 transporter permease [Planctomycetota bacterium]|jgi:ABC-type transport system involved in multi-copper enzyme maturation permease subunit